MNRLLNRKPDPKKKQKILQNIAKLNNKNKDNIHYLEKKKQVQENTKKNLQILKKKFQKNNDYNTFNKKSKEFFKKYREINNKKNNKNTSNNKNNKNITNNQEFTFINNFTLSNIISDAKVVYINLDSRKDRKDMFEKFYDNTTIEYERFPAVQTTLKKFKDTNPHLNLYHFSKTFKRSRTRWVNGTLGCYSSHYEILKKYNNDDTYKYLVVLEDDCIIPEDYLKYCLHYIQDNPTIDVLRVNNWDKKLRYNKEPFNFNFKNKYSRFSEKTKDYADGGTHICIYHINRIQNVLDYMHVEYVYHIDALFSTNNINSWCIRIPKNIKYNSVSSIQHSIISKNKKLLKFK